MTYRYAFLLGRETAISTAEIEAVFARLNLASKNAQTATPYLFITTNQELDPATLMDRLGGTIKIMRHVPTTGSMDQAIANYLEHATPTGKLHFSLNGRASEHLAKAVKKKLKERGRSVRYIPPKNSATILYNDLVKRRADLTIFNKEIYVTEALQPFAEFGERDYGRPRPAARRGMLPPKLARIMINLAEAPLDATILDPFCGSGTILTEAVAMKYQHVIGADLSPPAIEGARKNLDWTHKHLITLSPYHLITDTTTNDKKNDIKLVVSSVQELPKKIKPQSIDAIVTEPYLGKPLHGNESRNQLEAQAKELAKLYGDAFASFAKLLKPSGAVIFVSPAFQYEKDEWLRVRWQIEVEQMGFMIVPFSKQTPYLQYARPNQHVMREIWKFKKR